MEGLSGIISAGTGPIIIISACGLLCLAFYNRLSGLVSRLRLFHRERLKEQEALGHQRTSAQQDQAEIVMHQEMLGAMEVQTTHLMRRARLVQKSLSCFLLTIACLSTCSLLLGLSVLWQALIVAAVVFFVVGMVVLIVGVVFAMMELRRALQPVELESRFVTEIIDSIARLTE
jgi:hypothetical protein